MSIPSNIPPQIPQNDLNPEIHFEVDQMPDIDIQVDAQPDLDIQVDAQPDLDVRVETVIDVDENANLLVELEKALLDDAGIDTNTLDKNRILNVSAHFEKEGADAKSPIVAHTYIRQKTIRVYNPQTDKMEKKQVDVTCWKFKATWKMEVLELDGVTTKTVTRTAWMKTPIELPKNMKDPSEITHSQYLALLHVKAVRHAYKAALYPKHIHHQRTQETIQYLRSNNTLRISFMPDPQKWQQQLVNLRKGKMAYYAVIKLKDAQNKNRMMEIDYFKTATKVDEAGTKWVNTPSNIHSTAYNIAMKHREQQIVSHDERLTQFEALKKTSPENFLQKFTEYQNGCRRNPTYALITAQYYKDLMKVDVERKKNEFDATVSQLDAQFAGNPALQVVEGLTGLVPKALIEANIEDRIEKVRIDLDAYDNEANPQMKQMKAFTLVSEMKDLCKAAKALEDIRNEIVNKMGQLNALIGQQGEGSISAEDLKSFEKTTAKLKEKLETYRPLINVQPRIAALAAALGPITG